MFAFFGYAVALACIFFIFYNPIVILWLLGLYVIFAVLSFWVFGGFLKS